MRGRMDFVNSFMSLTTKQSPWGPQDTTCDQDVSSSILHELELNGVSREQAISGHTCRAS